MPALNLATNLANHDDLYERLIALHEGLSDEESHKASAKLILLLANHIGDEEVVIEAIETVKGQLSPG